jgi:biotin synthase
MKKLLDSCTENGIDKNTALEIYSKSGNPLNALELFKKAFKLREDTVGNDLQITVPTGVILECKLDIPCRYCNSWAAKASSPELSSKRLENVLQCIPKLREIGINKILLVGGSNINGYDQEILELVKSINDVSDIGIEINFGGSVSKDTVKKLKKMNVVGITSSIEIYNEEIFKHAKPGDSLDKRKELLQIAEDEGLPIRSFMLPGLGESYEDRIEHLFYLKSFKQMKNLVFSSFKPSKGTSYANRPPFPSWEVAKMIAIARLIMPNINIATAHSVDLADIPLWYISGGNDFFGVAIVQVKELKSLKNGEEFLPVNQHVGILNRMSIVKHQLEGMGCNVNIPELEFK